MQKYKTLKEFFDNIKEPRKSEVEALRKIILETEPDVKEQLKWNAPSYSYHSNDRITFNVLSPHATRLIFHVGGTMQEDKKATPAFKDETDLLEWVSNIRAIATFDSLEQIHTHKKDLSKIINKWLETFDS